MLVVLFVVYNFLGGEFGFLNLMRLMRNNNDLQHQKRELTAEIVDLEYSLKRLESDPLYVQGIARSRYGLAAEDEFLILIPEYKPQ